MSDEMKALDVAADPLWALYKAGISFEDLVNQICAGTHDWTIARIAEDKRKAVEAPKVWP